jgi:hypothetical protein
MAFFQLLLRIHSLESVESCPEIWVSVDLRCYLL